MRLEEEEEEAAAKTRNIRLRECEMRAYDVATAATRCRGPIGRGDRSYDRVRSVVYPRRYTEVFLFKKKKKTRRDVAGAENHTRRNSVNALRENARVYKYTFRVCVCII